MAEPTPPQGLETFAERQKAARTQKREDARNARLESRTRDYSDDPFGIAFGEQDAWQHAGEQADNYGALRRASIPGAISERLRNVARGWGGDFSSGDPSWQDVATQRNALIALLQARDNSENELEQQGMRYNYQVRTAEAQELNALAGILKQGMSSATSASVANANIMIQAALERGRDMNEAVRTQGLLYGELYQRPDNASIKAVRNILDRKNVGAKDPSLTGQRLIDVPGKDGMAAVDALQNALAVGLKGSPEQGAVFLERLSRDLNFDVANHYGLGIEQVADAEGNPVYRVLSGAGPRGPRLAGGQFQQTGTLEPDVLAALRKQVEGRNNDTQFLKYKEENMASIREAGTFVPGEIQFVKDAIVKILDRQKIPPNTLVRKDEITGKFVPVEMPDGGGEVGVSTQETTSAPAEEPPSTSSFDQQVQAQIDHLDNPNPPSKVLQQKQAIIDTELYKTWKAKEQYQTDDVGYRKFIEEARDRRKAATAKDEELAASKNQEADDGKAKLKDRLGNAFGFMRPRFRDARLRREKKEQGARVTGGTPIDNNTSESDAKNAKPDLPPKPPQ